ncbi:DUF3526 domain-containing protein [Hyphococcus lacteus]|uniref:DUF3526 domain-containing protein n=1 Tax=Hyphococcus lacteus TaxID=3143536 RepID=A0ABV3Z643_9PROT
MIGAIAQREIVSFLRSSVFVSIAAAFVVLLTAAAFLSVERVKTFERERTAAEQVDRYVWDSQGERNPHSAAHFARYAFKPIPKFVAFDPGITDYAGIALWMEAHYQNPAVFRRAEDLGDAGHIANLSPAWVLQVIAPLFVFLVLFGALAGERESGTLRQLSAMGVTARTLFSGKLLGAGVGLGAIIIPALVFVLFFAGHTGGDDILPDKSIRLIGLVLSYVLYFVSVSAIAIGVSALMAEKRAALIALVALWAGSFVVTPRITADIASTVYAGPDSATISRALDGASNAFYQDSEYRAEIDRVILKEYGVESKDELPIEYGAYSLQKSEEHAHPLFEKIYANLNAVHKKQEGVLRAASLISPTIALNALSAGLAGSDRVHHQKFVEGAEVHRRKIVKQLNEDYMYNAGEAGYGYAAGEAFWKTIEDFSYIPPTFLSLFSSYAFGIIVLFAYAVFGIFFAMWAVRRAQKRIAK